MPLNVSQVARLSQLELHHQLHEHGIEAGTDDIDLELRAKLCRKVLADQPASSASLMSNLINMFSAKNRTGGFHFY